MKHIKKIKIMLISFSTTALILASPAEAQAPKLSKMELLQHMAYQTPKKYAQQALKKYKWNSKQYACLTKLWGKESAWNHLADNPTSTAFGIAQMLREKSRNPMTQINNGLRYIEHRYGTPCAAWQHWQRRNWY
jgi:hypothetical protein